MFHNGFVDHWNHRFGNTARERPHRVPNPPAMMTVLSLRTFISWKDDRNNILVKSYAKKNTAASIANS